ncbi:acyltransferase family protein [Vibrio sp.]|uniref:Acyltransferase n=1 Tax=Vibrio viridaestus TaxID=2487322 RepID=A0A3N9TBW4_9VIBR|nr:acyltransferase family protein [Vibrio viridaestus]MDC0611237.1 acyltransferase family protein [Vibrio sp.]RQW61500.1 acyltransferase [Vibrio viridaestus]
MMQRIFYFDLLRCIAAFAVVAIHTLGPYRAEIGNISFDQWGVAVGLNSVSRWAVPVFLLISGALLVGDRREFDIKYYFRRRVGKVIIPFVVWSVFYAFLSGLNRDGFQWDETQEHLVNLPFHESYYHLGFFYYFIPLYLLAPAFQWLAKHNEKWLVGYVAVWGLTTVAFLLHIDGPWTNMLWLYSGYMPLGYLLASKEPLNRIEVMLVALVGFMAAFITAFNVLADSYVAQDYAIGRWLSYKTINTVLLASAIFLIAKQYGNALSSKQHQAVGVISRYSLGIYLLHPIFLWPMQNFELYHAHPIWIIPLWLILSLSGALGLSWLLARSRKTAWLVP